MASQHSIPVSFPGRSPCSLSVSSSSVATGVAPADRNEATTSLAGPPVLPLLRDLDSRYAVADWCRGSDGPFLGPGMPVLLLPVLYRMLRCNERHSLLAHWHSSLKRL